MAVKLRYAGACSSRHHIVDTPSHKHSCTPSHRFNTDTRPYLSSHRLLDHTVHSTNNTFFTSYPSCSARLSDRWRMRSSSSAVNSSPSRLPPDPAAEVGVGVVPVAAAPPPLQGTGPASACMACLTSSCLGAGVLPKDDDNDEDDDDSAGLADFFAGLLVT